MATATKPKNYDLIRGLEKTLQRETARLERQEKALEDTRMSVESLREQIANLQAGK